MKTEVQLELIKLAGPLIAGLIQMLRGSGMNAQATVLEETFAADADWRRVLADDPNAPPPAS